MASAKSADILRPSRQRDNTQLATRTQRAGRCEVVVFASFLDLGLARWGGSFAVCSDDTSILGPVRAQSTAMHTDLNESCWRCWVAMATINNLCCQVATYSVNNEQLQVLTPGVAITIKCVHLFVLH